MADARPQILVQLELTEGEQRFLLHLLTAVVQRMEEDGFAQRQPERARVAACLLLQLQNKMASRRITSEPVPSEPVPSPVTDTEGYEF